MRENTMIRAVSGLKYTLTIKDVKNINLRIGRDGSISVSANRKTPFKKVDEFVAANADKIKNYLQKAETQTEMRLIPETFKNGAEFYFLGEKRFIATTDKDDSYLDGNTLYLTNKYNNDVGKAFRKWLSDVTVETLCKYVDMVYKQFEKYNVPYPRIAIKPMKSEWGNCYPTKVKITLNMYLMATPPDCIYYVVVHEFAHFLHPNHSKYFWAVVAQFVPDYKEKRKEMKKYSAL